MKVNRCLLVGLLRIFSKVRKVLVAFRGFPSLLVALLELCVYAIWVRLVYLLSHITEFSEFCTPF